MKKYSAMLPWVPPMLDSSIRLFFWEHGTRLSVKKGESLLSESEDAQALYYVHKGILGHSIVDYMWNKSAITCNIVVPGSVSGCTGYIVNKFVPVHIQALQKSSLFMISYADMKMYLQSKLEQKEMFGVHCSLCLKSVTDALMVIASLQAEERIKTFLSALLLSENSEDLNLDYSTIPYNITRSTIGRAVYVSTMTLDRILSKWAKDGIIRRNGPKYEILTDTLAPALSWITQRSQLMEK